MESLVILTAVQTVKLTTSTLGLSTLNYSGLSLQLVYRNHCTDLSPQQYTEMSMHGLSPQQWTGLSLTDRFSSVSPVTKQMLCLFYSVEAVLSSYKYQMINSVIWIH